MGSPVFTALALLLLYTSISSLKFNDTADADDDKDPHTMSDAHQPSSTFTEAWLPGPGDHKFYTRTYTPEHTPYRAVVLSVHGFAEHITRHESEHAAWAARGFVLFAYDHRGFGRTALDTAHKSPGAAYGKTSQRHLLRDLEFWVRHVHAQYPTLKIYLMGQSMVCHTY